MEQIIIQYFPLIVSCLFLLFIFIIFYKNKDYVISSSSTKYEERFNAFLQKTEELTMRLNMLENLIISSRNDQAINFYEKSLLKFEKLLLAFQDLKNHKNDIPTLKSAMILLKHSEKQVKKLEDFLKIKFKKNTRKKSVLPSEKKLPIGCYFCSKPFSQTTFTKVKVKIDNEVKKVFGCEECAKKLKTTGTVKILYFSKNGKTYHWSQIPDYNPLLDYKNVAKLNNSIKKDTSLKLVYSKPEQKLDDIDSQNNKD